METEAPPLPLVKRANVTANSPNVNPPKVAVRWQSVGKLKLYTEEGHLKVAQLNITELFVQRQTSQILLCCWTIPKGSHETFPKLGIRATVIIKFK